MNLLAGLILGKLGYGVKRALKGSPGVFRKGHTSILCERELTNPWTNGQAERMNRTVKDATIKVFHYPDLESLKAHIRAFVSAYNFAKHLKRLRWRTPFQAICEAWAKDPAPFKGSRHRTGLDSR